MAARRPDRRATRSAGASRRCRPGRAGAARRGGRALAERRRADRPRLRPGAAARRDARRGRPSGRGRRSASRRRRRPARSRSSSAASTAGSPAARTASRSSPTASCSARSASAGRRRCAASSRATSSSASTPGDLVVHIDHGVARYEQMLRRGGRGRGARLPRAVVRRRRPDLRPGRADRPGHPLRRRRAAAALASSAAPSGCATKQRVRKAVDGPRRGAARAVRRRAPARHGHAFAPTRPGRPRWRRRSRTRRRVDQLRAVGRGQGRHGAGRPMDRLVVGDVGYGKTEVALRAAFKAIQDGKQVAVLVPDDRPRRAAPRDVLPAVRGVPARGPAAVAVRRRRRSRPRRSRAWPTGSVDIVIGTHRLLSKDVAVQGPRPGRRRRGAAVRRRGQGAAQAAPPRGRRADAVGDADPADAQPGARRRSATCRVIETPPEDRLPIQTRVAEASAGLVRDAILRELDRGGQVFYVHNRVETIEAQAEQLRRLLPGARFVVGHGQMPEGALEKVMIAFADGEADVLVCTTIIESGLDIPNANTIVIDRADTLGLAQLYQLRGRVGPVVAAGLRLPAVPAPRAAVATRPASGCRRSSTPRSSGAGFQIALSDLEIRGAGNILGGEQSGHMAAVGFDLYSRLLAEAVEEQKASTRGPGADRRGAAGRRRPAGRRPPARRLRPRRGPEARAVPAAGAGPIGRRPRRVPPGGHRPLRRRCRRRSRGSSRSPSCGWPPRRPAWRRSRARRAGWSSGSGPG